MPCLAIGPPTLPTIPSPFSITPPSIGFPGVSAGVTVCCITKTFTLPPYPIPMPPFATPAAFMAFLALVDTAEAALQAFMDEWLVLSIPCPKQ